MVSVFFFQAEDGIRDADVTGVQTCALPISVGPAPVRCASVPHHGGYAERDDHERQPDRALLSVKSRSGENGSSQAPQMIGACSRVDLATRSLRPEAHEQARKFREVVWVPSWSSAWRHSSSALPRPESWSA